LEHAGGDRVALGGTLCAVVGAALKAVPVPGEKRNVPQLVRQPTDFGLPNLECQALENKFFAARDADMLPISGSLRVILHQPERPKRPNAERPY